MNKNLNFYKLMFARLFRLGALVLMMLMISPNVFAQLTGIRNVPGDYGTLALAITDLNAQGVGAGGVIINVIAGNAQNAPAGGYSITTLTSSAANPIIIQGNGNTATAPTPQTSGSLTDAIFKIIGGDYITITGFTMLENAANTTTAAATNNMTEFGVALFYATTTNGAQSDTIKNNIITLNRTYQNTFGIYSNSTHSATSITVAASATTAAGTNSGLTITGNTISNVNQGIVIVGPTAAADHNDNIIIGGSSGNGNSITNYGTTATFSGYLNVSGTVNGVLIRNTKNFNVSYNTIASSNAGMTGTGTLRGIFAPSASAAFTGAMTNTINNNNISLKGGNTANILHGIFLETTSTNTSTTLSVSNNDFNNFSHPAGTGLINFISITNPALNTTINGNTWTNLSVSTTGTVTFIGYNETKPANAVVNVNNNAIVGTFTRTGASGTTNLYTPSLSSPSTVTETNTGNNFSNITLSGTGSFSGWVTNDGTTTSPYGPVKTITNNTFNNITVGSGATSTIFDVGGGSSGTVSGNTVSNITGGSTTALNGMRITGGAMNIFGNTVHSMTNSGTAGVLSGIITASGATAGSTNNIYQNKVYNLTSNGITTCVTNGLLIAGSTSAMNLNIYNNIIGDLKAPSSTASDAIRGIATTATSTLSTFNVYYNTIWINAASSASTFGSSGVTHFINATATTAVLNLRNNIIVNTSIPGSGSTVAYRRTSANSFANYASTSDNNLFYAGTPGLANVIFYDGTGIQNLGDFQTLVSPREAASVSQAVNFSSTTGGDPNFLHINTGVATLLDNGGVNISGITTDYDNEARAGNVGYLGTGGAPDIGADEFEIVIPCIAPPEAGTATVNPAIGVCTGASLTLNLSGSTTGNGQSYQWQYYDSTSSSFVNQSGLLTSSAYNFIPTSTKYYRCMVVCSGQPDSSSLVLVKVNLPLSGNYTVNYAASSLGNNFQTLAEVVSALSCGVTGPVVFNIDSLPATEQQLIFTPVTGASSTNTITFNGNGRRLTYNSTNANERAVIKFNGADHITVNNFIITDTSGTYGYGVQMLNDADSNTVSNCVINIVSTSTSSTNYAGVLINSIATAITTTGASLCDGNTISGNSINGGYAGVAMVANTTTSVIHNNKVTANTIKDFYLYGVYLNGGNNTLIESNDISRPTRSTVSTYNGIYLTTNSTNTQISKNRLHNPFGNSASSTSAAFCIYLTACNATVGNENIISNNIIYDHIGSTGNHNGLLFNNSSHAKYYHNTILLNDEDAICSTCAARGFYQQGTATGLTFKDNIVMISQGGTAPKECIFFETVSVASYVLDNNVYYMASTDGDYNSIARIGGSSSDPTIGTAFATLADWQAGSSQEAGSEYADPIFTSVANGNLSPIASAVNDSGAFVGITTDFNGNPRSNTTPDPGAYEFTPPTLEAGITWISPVAPLAAGLKTITVSIANNQVTTIDSVMLAYSDGINVITESFTGLSIVTGASQQFSFATQFNFTGSASLRAYITSVNGVSDGNQNNDTTATQNLCVALAGGTYSINKSFATGGGNYASFTDAVTAISSCGILGAVEFYVVTGNGIYTEQITIPPIAGASAVNTITFNGSGDTLQYYSANTNARHVIKLSGADYITINNLVIKADTGTYGWGIHMATAANNNTISNCKFVSSKTSTTSGSFYSIVVSNSSTSATTAGNNGNFNTITGNTISGGYYGLAVIGNSAAGQQNQNNKITNNDIEDFYAQGIYLTYQKGLQVSGNDISRRTRTNTTTAYGVYLSTGNVNCLVEKNRIHNMTDAQNTSTSTIYGIYLSADGTAALPNNIQNNVIYNFNHLGTAYGIYNTTAPYTKIYHNTISFDDTTATGSSTTTYGLYQSGSTSGIEYYNNIVTISRRGTGSKYCIYFSTSGSVNASDNNNLYMNSTAGTTNKVGYYGGTTYTALADWQTANGGIYDAASASVDPGYTDAANGNFTPTAAVLNGLGTNVGVTTDIIGTTRNTFAPDPGAFEFALPGLDAAISWVAPLAPLTLGSHTVTVNIANTRTTTITKLTLSYTDGSTIETETFTGVNILPNTAQQISFTNQYNLTATTDIYAYIDSVNGVLDDLSSNDTTDIQTLCTVFAGGIYTINSNLATAGSNFNNFTSAISRLICGGINGPVVFNVVAGSGPYNEQVALPAIGGSSATNTITFNGNGETLRYPSSVSGARHVVKLDGADYITFNNLNIDADGGTYGWGIHFINGADYNTIKECTITTSTTSTSNANFAGITFTGSTSSLASVGNQGNHNLITGNTVIGGYYGIDLYGTSTAATFPAGNQVLNNTVQEFYVYGIYLRGQLNAIVSGNDISRPTRTTSTTTYGIYNPTYALNNQVTNNRIHNLFGGDATPTSTGYGIYTSASGAEGSENIFANNLIYNFIGSGIHYGIYNTGGDYMRCYHNTIAFSDTASGTTTTYGFYQSTSVPGIDYRNNIVSITRAGTGNKYCIYFVTSGSTHTSNNNNLYMNSPAGTSNNVGYYGGTAYPTLIGWRTANGGIYDAQSDSINPAFLNTATGDYEPTAVSLDNQSVDVGVATDINGNSRSLTTPDVGAYEFTNAPIDLMPIALFSPAGNGCASASEVVVVTIRNRGSNPLDFTVTPATVTANITGAVNAVLTASLVTGNLPPLATMNVALTPTLDLSAQGIYTFSISTAILGDGNTGNDTLNDVTRNTNISSGIVSANVSSICGTAIPVLTLSGNSNGNIQWQSSTTSATAGFGNVGSGGTTYTPSAISQTTYYRAVVYCNAYGDTSDVVPVIYSNPQPLDTTAGQRCGSGTVILDAQVASGQSTRWYSTANGGVIAGSGSPFTTPVIHSTDTFYVSATEDLEQLISNPLSPASVSTSGGTGNYGYYVTFTLASTLTIASVDIYPNILGQNASIQITDAAGAVLNTIPYTTTVAGGATAQVVPLNVTLPPGSYRMKQGGTHIALYRNTAGATYPYTTGDLSITGHSFASGPAYYYFFYRWIIETSCEGGRVPVIATVIPATSINAVSSDLVICEGDTATLSVTSSNNDYTYIWTPGNLAGDSVYVTPSIPTQYIVKANDAGTSCESYDTLIVYVNPAPVATATISRVNVCSGDTAQLNVIDNFTGTGSDYGITAIGHNPIPTPGSGVTVLRSTTDSVALNFGDHDDGYWLNQPLPFIFSYFGTPYNDFAVNVNGFVNPGSVGVERYGHGDAIPNVDVPNNCIGGMQSDLDLRWAGRLEYFTTGSTPNQRVVINYVDVPFFASGNSSSTPETDGRASFQIHLLENNTIEVHITSIINNNTTTRPKTLGIENGSGTIAYAVPGRNNSTNWNLTSPDAVRFANFTYQYAWSPTTGLSNPAIKNPVATATDTITYTVTVSNTVTGCTETSSVTINELPVPSPKIYPGDTIICQGSSFYQHVIDTGVYSGGYPVGTTVDWVGIVNGLSPEDSVNTSGISDFSVIVHLPVGVGGCSSDTSSIAHITTHQLDIIPTIVNSTCGSSNGKIIVNVVGTAPYHYTWSDGINTIRDIQTSNTSDSITGLAASNYYLTVIDNEGNVNPGLSCNSGQLSYFVVSNGGPVASISAQSDVHCTGGNDGSATVSQTGGIGIISYEWFPYGGNLSTSDPLGAGSFFVVVTDGNGCVDTAEVVIGEPDSLLVSANAFNATCDSSDGVGIVTVQGGRAPYTYTWYNDVFDDMLVYNDTISILAAGTYYVVVGDSANYCFSIDTIEVSEICSVVLNLNAFIEGYYVGGGAMQPVMYNADAAIGNSYPNQTDCDTITVELHDQLSPAVIVSGGTAQAMLQVDGTAELTYPGTIQGGSYWIVVKNRTMVETWSSQPVTFTGLATSYNFTTIDTMAFSNNMREIEAGYWVMYSGDIDDGSFTPFQDGFVDIFDYLIMDVDIQSGNAGYYVTDLNGDGFIDIFDFLVLDPNIQTGVSKLTPP